jgi:predicted regulator of amino acid metabolism with ACT domain
MNEIVARNVETLSTLSTAFCEINGLGQVNDELAQAICLAVNSALKEWYVNNGKVYSPATEIIEEEALKYAFGEVQKIAILAKMAALAGM